MNYNFFTEINNEIQFFLNKFIKNDWIFKDELSVTKKYLFKNNDSENEKEIDISLSLYPELISYMNEKSINDNIVYDNIVEIWTCCEISIPFNDIDIIDLKKSPMINFLTKTIKDEISKFGYSPFYNQKSFKRIFTYPKINESLNIIEMKFYLNSDYGNKRKNAKFNK